MADIKLVSPGLTDEEEDGDPPEHGPHVVIPSCVYPTSAYCSDAGFIVIRQDRMESYGETVTVLIPPVFLQALIDRLTALRDGEE